MVKGSDHYLFDYPKLYWLHYFSGVDGETDLSGWGFLCGRFGDATNIADRDGGAKRWLDRNEVEFRMGVAAMPLLFFEGCTSCTKCPPG